MELVSLEENMRLSKSILWDLQSHAYCQFGPDAWSNKGVPSYVTSNPFTALQYAHVVLGYLRDCMTPDSPTPIDPAHPVYLFDLGAGTGRFGFLFLGNLLNLLRPPGLNNIKLCYVMTDIADKNIAFCQEHPYLKPYIEEGILDFARYHHADHDQPLHLIQSKQKINKNNIINPIVLIANYFFDTIPQDLFRLKNGRLEEGRISISIEPCEGMGEISANNPKIIPQMRCSYNYEPIQDTKNYYGDCPEINKILELYARQFDNIPFLFPIGAFQSLRFFQELSKGRMCLCAGDQGVCTADQVAQWGEPKISRHGTFSIPVSYHALANYFIASNGAGLMTSFPDPQFVVMTGLLGGNLAQFPETDQAFLTHFDFFEPSDYWNIVNCAEKECGQLSLEYMFLLLKLGNWDPMVFNSFFAQIRQQATAAPFEAKLKLKDIVEKVWKNFFPIGPEGGNFIMNLGVLLFELNDYKRALAFFKQALDLMGKQPQILQNIAVCLKKMSNE